MTLWKCWLFTFIPITDCNISSSWILLFIFRNSHFKVYEFKISALRKHDFNFTNSTSWIHVFNIRISTSWHHEFNIVKKKSWIRKVEIVKYKIWIQLKLWSTKHEFMSSWNCEFRDFYEVQMSLQVFCTFTPYVV
jgi:hypothetical protein